MGVYEGRGQLARAMKDLLLRWAETKSEWDDAMSRNFEKQFILPLEAELRSATSAMEHMATILAQIHRDCE